MEISCGQDEDGDWSFYYRVLLSSGYTAEFRFHPYPDWGQGSSKDGLALVVELVLSKKRKRISKEELGTITGVGGVDTYLAFAHFHEDAVQQILQRYERKYSRIHVYGYNERLQEAYKKILPRLGFTLNYRGEWAMEKIINKERICTCGYC